MSALMRSTTRDTVLGWYECERWSGSACSRGAASSALPERSLAVVGSSDELYVFMDRISELHTS